MRTCGAEKLPWLVVEVEVDAERAGCFAERQLRLGLVVDEAIPATRDRLSAHAERTNSKLNARFGAVHGGKGRGGTGRVPKHTHLSRRVAWSTRRARFEQGNVPKRRTTAVSRGKYDRGVPWVF